MPMIPSLLLAASLCVPAQQEPEASMRTRRLVQAVHADAARRLADVAVGKAPENVVVVPLGISSAAIGMSQVVGPKLRQGLLEPYVGAGFDASSAADGVRKLVGSLRQRAGKGLTVGGSLVVPQALQLGADCERIAAALGLSIERTSSREELLRMAWRVPMPTKGALGRALVDAKKAHPLGAAVDRVASVWFGGELEWLDPFDESETALGHFYPEEGRAVWATMMRRPKGTYDFGRSDDFSVLRMPLRGPQLAVELWLPDGFLDPAALRELLTKAMVGGAGFRPELVPERVDVLLPKVDAASRWRVLGGDEVATAVGAVAGSQVAAFGMDEKGVGVGSLTMVSGGPGTGQRRRVSFFALRPFVAVVRDRRHDLVIAAAIVADPNTGTPTLRRPK